MAFPGPLAQFRRGRIVQIRIAPLFPICRPPDAPSRFSNLVTPVRIILAV